jgi:NitT/TauT family transport system ATP-binding protein
MSRASLQTKNVVPIGAKYYSDGATENKQGFVVQLPLHGSGVTEPYADRETKLSVKDIVIGYHNKESGEMLLTVDKVSLDIKEGEIVTIVGLSGCGKSTFLYAVAGLVPYQGGEILVGGKKVTGPGPDRSMVFQKASLLPWRRVRKNITYGLELNGVAPDVAEKKAHHYIELIRLNGFENHYPNQLSGGMQQRVNLARALVCDPEVLLMDEPFAALDAITRELMQRELLSLCEKVGKTVLMVTHQIDEAVLLSDRVLVFSARPAQILADIKITFPRPRDGITKDSPEFRALESKIWEIIETNANVGGGI